MTRKQIYLAGIALLCSLGIGFVAWNAQRTKSEETQLKQKYVYLFKEGMNTPYLAIPIGYPLINVRDQHGELKLDNTHFLNDHDVYCYVSSLERGGTIEYFDANSNFENALDHRIKLTTPDGGIAELCYGKVPGYPL